MEKPSKASRSKQQQRDRKQRWVVPGTVLREVRAPLLTTEMQDSGLQREKPGTESAPVHRRVCELHLKLPQCWPSAGGLVCHCGSLPGLQLRGHSQGSAGRTPPCSTASSCRSSCYSAVCCISESNVFTTEGSFTLYYMNIKAFNFGLFKYFSYSIFQVAVI